MTIRTITQKDIPAIVKVSETSGLFIAEQVGLVEQMIHGSLAESSPDTPFWLVIGEEEIEGIAYMEPERMTEGTWNIQLIAVTPESQGKGVGRRLLAGIESRLRQREARLVLVETSGTDDFISVRAFYERNGFRQEARIREFYAQGVDKVTYTRKLD